MACNCNTPGALTNWWDLISFPPKNPFDLIAKAQIIIGGNTDVGVYTNSATYGAPATWAANSFAINGAPQCVALETDNNLQNAKALQWNAQHLTWDNGSTIPPQLQRLVFLRGDTQWQMNIPLNLGGGSYPLLELSFLDNAGTRGDYRGTYPVLQFAARNYTGSVSLQLTLKQMGRVRFGISATDVGGNQSMFDFEAIIVP